MDSAGIKTHLVNFIAALGVLLAIALLVLIWALKNTVDDLREQIPRTGHALRQSLADISSDSNLIREHLDRDLIVIGAAASEWQKASKAQAKYSADALQKTGEALDAAKNAVEGINNSAASLATLIEHTDFDLNDARTGAIPQLQADAFVLTQKLSALAESMTVITNHADEKISDPETAAQLIAALTAARETLEKLNATAGSVQLAADESQKRLHQLLKPASLTKSIFMGLLGGAARAAQIGTALK